MAHTMKNKEDIFLSELEVFRTEIEQAIQFFYTRNAMNAVLAKNKSLLAIVNRTPRFWITTDNALHTAFFIVLGRIFDNSSRHNIDQLLCIAQEQIEIFSKDALTIRTRASARNSDDVIDEFMEQAYIPTHDDFSKLMKHVAKYRNIYDNAYRDIRNKVIAHKVLSNPEKVYKLYAGTKIKEVEKLLRFLNQLYHALWHLFYNGMKPVLKNMKYSAKRMSQTELSQWVSTYEQEHAVDDTVKFFKLLKTIPAENPVPVK